MSAPERPTYSLAPPNALHGLTFDYAGGTAYGAPLLARCTAPGCPWTRSPGTEPLELTIYWHWLHQLDEIRDDEIRAEVARERHQA